MRIIGRVSETLRTQYLDLWIGSWSRNFSVGLCVSYEDITKYVFLRMPDLHRILLKPG